LILLALLFFGEGGTPKIRPVLGILKHPAHAAYVTRVWCYTARFRGVVVQRTDIPNSARKTDASVRRDEQLQRIPRSRECETGRERKREREREGERGGGMRLQWDDR